MSQRAVAHAVGRRGARREPRAPRVEPGTEVGSYRVEARLGAGGFGTVYRAHRGGQRYAVKLVSLEEAGEWGVREVLALSRVSHPHVVRLHGFWQWPEQAPRFLVVVMEYVEGRRLDVWTRTENPSALRVLRLVRGLARALEAAHRARVVHRDVKPANALVREEDGEVVLVDFGVSGWEGASQVTGGMMPPGTVAYRSPEAWRFARENAGKAGARYSAAPADDLYALGVVLYWLLTDTLPFPTEEGLDVEAVMTRAPEPPHERNPRVPRELGELCQRLLDKRPEARPDAAAVCAAVEELLTRQGEAWEQPLCEAFSEHNLTTRPEQSVNEEEQWAREAEDLQARRPRRGRRPPLEVEELAPPVPAPGLVEAGVPPAAAVPPEPPAAAPAAVEEVAAGASEQLAPPAARGSAVRVRVGVGMGLVAALGLLVLSLQGRELFHATPEPHAEATAAQEGRRTGLEQAGPTWEPGWKVAPPLKPPEAESVSPFEAEAARPAPVASGATAHPEEEASVKTPQKKQLKGLSPAKKAAAVAAACYGLACSGPQVRPPPPQAEPCPPGALEAMEELDIDIGEKVVATLFLTWEQSGARWTQVHEGKITLRLADELGELAQPTTVSGRLIFGERVYGRLTQATHEGKTFPVCLEIWDEGGGRGLIRKDEGGVDTATVFSTVFVKAVSEFK